MRSAKVTFKLIVLILAAIFAIAFSAPSIFQLEKGSKINLGLDLQGGLHMLLGVKTDEAIASRVKSVAASVNYSVKKMIF